MKTKQTIIDKVVEMKAQGYSSRIIAKELKIGKTTVNDIIKRLRNDPPHKLNIIFLDVETASSITATFGRFKQNI